MGVSLVGVVICARVCALSWPSLLNRKLISSVRMTDWLFLFLSIFYHKGFRDRWTAFPGLSLSLSNL